MKKYLLNIAAAASFLPQSSFLFASDVKKTAPTVPSSPTVAPPTKPSAQPDETPVNGKPFVHEISDVVDGAANKVRKRTKGDHFASPKPTTK